MECTSVTVEDEPRDVTDNSFLLKVEETLKEYITRMEVNTDFTGPDILLSSLIIITKKLPLLSTWT